MRSLLITSFVLATSTLAFGCSSSASPGTNTGSVSGAVSSAELTTLSAVARFGTFFPADGGQSTHGLRLLISDKANSCAVTHFASSTNLDLRVRGNSVGPGSYALANAVAQTPAPSQAEADLNAVDGVCKDLVAQTATGGTVIIKAVQINVTGPGVSHVSGSVDATFPGGHIAGDFDALLCDDSPADAGTSPGAGSPATCTP